MEDKTTYVDLNTKNLPSETWLHILSFLQPKDLLNVEMVCKLFKQISCDNTLWRSFVLGRTEQLLHEENILHKPLFLKSYPEQITAKATHILKFLFTNTFFPIHYSSEFEPNSSKGEEEAWLAVIKENFEDARVRPLDVAKKIAAIFKKNETHNDINLQGWLLNSVLHYFAVLGDKAALRFLIEDVKADPNQVNLNNKIPLHTAIIYGYPRLDLDTFQYLYDLTQTDDLDISENLDLDNDSDESSVPELLFNNLQSLESGLRKDRHLKMLAYCYTKTKFEDVFKNQIISNLEKFDQNIFDGYLTEMQTNNNTVTCS